MQRFIIANNFLENQVVCISGGSKFEDHVELKRKEKGHSQEDLFRLTKTWKGIVN